MHFEHALMHAPLHAGQRPPCRLLFAPAPPGDAAGLAAAQDLRRRHAQQARYLMRGFGGQYPARGEHRAQPAVQRRPVQLRRQALEMGRTGHQYRVLSVHRGQQVFRKEGARDDRAAGGQRPQHPEQQTVDVLVGDGPVYGRALQARTERSFQRVHLGIELSQPFLDRDRLARAARGEHDQPRRRRIERLQRGRGHIVGGRRQRGLRPIACETVHPPLQTRLRPGQRIAGQHHGLARVPGAVQGRSKACCIFEMERPCLRRRRSECSTPPQHVAMEVRMVAGIPTGRRERTTGLRQHRHLGQIAPVSHDGAPP